MCARRQYAQNITTIFVQNINPQTRHLIPQSLPRSEIGSPTNIFVLFYGLLPCQNFSLRPQQSNGDPALPKNPRLSRYQDSLAFGTSFVTVFRRMRYIVFKQIEGNSTQALLNSSRVYTFSATSPSAPQTNRFARITSAIPLNFSRSFTTFDRMNSDLSSVAFQQKSMLFKKKQELLVEQNCRVHI